MHYHLEFIVENTEGGEKNAIFSLIQYLNKIGIETDVLLLSTYASHKRFSYTFSFFKKVFFLYKKISEKINRKILYVCTDRPDGLACLILGKQFLYYFHGDRLFDKKLIKKKHGKNFIGYWYSITFNYLLIQLEFLMIKHSVYTIVPSPNSKNKLIFRHGAKIKNKIKIISNGVDTTKFKSYSKNKITQLKKIYNILPKKVVTYVGRIDEKKGLHFFLKLAELNKHNLNIIFLISCPRSTDLHSLNKLKEVIEEGELSNILLLQTSFKNMPDIYNISDCVMILSQQEEFSLVILESFACGVPIFCSDQANVLEIESKLHKNFLLKKNEPSYLNSKLSWIFSLNKNERKIIMTKSKKIAKSFSWKNSAKSFKKLITLN